MAPFSGQPRLPSLLFLAMVVVVLLLAHPGLGGRRRRSAKALAFFADREKVSLNPYDNPYGDPDACAGYFKSDSPNCAKIEQRAAHATQRTSYVFGGTHSYFGGVLLTSAEQQQMKKFIPQNCPHIPYYWKIALIYGDYLEANGAGGGSTGLSGSSGSSVTKIADDDFKRQFLSEGNYIVKSDDADFESSSEKKHSDEATAGKGETDVVSLRKVMLANNVHKKFLKDSYTALCLRQSACVALARNNYDAITYSFLATWALTGFASGSGHCDADGRGSTANCKGFILDTVVTMGNKCGDAPPSCSD